MSAYKTFFTHRTYLVSIYNNHNRLVNMPAYNIGTRPVKPFGNRDHLDGNNRYLSGLSG